MTVGRLIAKWFHKLGLPVSSKFIEFCRKNIAQSFAQNFQDLFALWAAGGKRSGYFVEFGALNGRDFSNTYMLEKIGWHGIVAEPHPDFASRIPAVRNCNFSPLCVYDKTGEDIPFRVVAGRPALSGIAMSQLEDERSKLRNNFREVMVKTITLNDLLTSFNAPFEIDFISVDTEGSELLIMQAFDFTRHNVKAFCIERNSDGDALAALLQANGYRKWFPEIAGHDDWWLKNDIVPVDENLGIQVSDIFSESFDRDLETRKGILNDHFARHSRG